MTRFAICAKIPMKFTAGSKAVIDATEIARKEGYKPLYFISKVSWLPNIRALRNVKNFINKLRALTVCRKINAKHTYFLQWPNYDSNIEYVYKALLEKRPPLKVLIHDLNVLRKGALSFEDQYCIPILEMAETVIAHTDNMKNYLVSIGIDSAKIKVLTCFDYLTKDLCPERSYSCDIVYAGNLSKSVFLKRMDTSKITMNCYGISNGDLSANLRYMGKFQPDNVSVLKGSWGLVWDGESTETCSGDYGEYLKYNSPHKVSLYIVSGLPIIIWNKQALAKFITEYGLGVAVASLKEAVDVIEQISNEEYNAMSANVRKMALDLKNGKHLKTLLK